MYPDDEEETEATPAPGSSAERRADRELAIKERQSDSSRTRGYCEGERGSGSHFQMGKSGIHRPRRGYADLDGECLGDETKQHKYGEGRTSPRTILTPTRSDQDKRRHECGVQKPQLLCDCCSSYRSAPGHFLFLIRERVCLRLALNEIGLKPEFLICYEVDFSLKRLISGQTDCNFVFSGCDQ